MSSKMMVFTGNSNTDLARKVASRLYLEIGSAKVGKFSDGEVTVELNENVRGKDVFIIQPTCAPTNDNLMEILLMADGLRRASASRITAVVPYFGYARQDRRPRSARVPISARAVADMMSGAGIDRVLTVDLHADQIQGFFDIPVDNLYASPVFALDVKHHFKDLSQITVVSPDVGGVARARELAERIHADLAIVDKRRSGPGEVESLNVIGDVKDRICIIIDDIVDTAGTLCKAADLLIAKGAKEVHAYISHGVLSGPAVERITGSAMKSLVVTDSIEATPAIKKCKKIRFVPTAPMFAQAIVNIANGTSVSSLFDDSTLGPLYEAYYPGA